MSNDAAAESLLRLSARKLAHTLFGGVETEAWYAVVDRIVDGENAEELVWAAIDDRGLFARDTVHAELVGWLEEDAAARQEDEDC